MYSWRKYLKCGKYDQTLLNEMGRVETLIFDTSYFPLSIFSCVCSLFIFYVIAPYLSQKYLEAYGKFDLITQLLWRGNILSSTHSIVVCSLCLYAFCFEPWLSVNPVSEESVVVRSSCAILVGYMFADTYITVRHFRYIDDIGFIFHHFACAYGYYAPVIYGVLCYFANYRLMAELSTPFVNMRWVLSTLGYSKADSVYFINGIAMLVSFYGVRILAMPFYWYKVYTVYNTVYFNKLGSMRLVLFIPCFVLDVLNICWGYKMYIGARKTIASKLENGRKESW